MNDNSLSRKIEDYIKNMPSLPVSISRILEICNQSNVSPADLNHVISLDPVLTGRVLKLINSVYYGLGQKVTSMVRAIIMLGINTVKNLALSTAVLGTMPANKDIQGINMEGFWRHSFCVGVTAKLIAKKTSVDPQQIEEHFTAGLLHDIGKVSFNAILAGDYLKIVSDAERNKIPLYKAEEKNLNFNHCTSGEMIVKAWNLNGPVADAIIYHHNLAGYSGNNYKALCIIAISNYFACVNEIGFSGDREPEKPVDEIWKTIGIDEDYLEEIKESISKEIDKAKIFLKL